MRGLVLLVALTATGLTIALAATACSYVAETSIAGGIGAPCGTDADCQGAQCTEGLCSTTCTSDPECPAPSRCLGQQCQLPLVVGVLHVGVSTATEGWTLTHHEGLALAAAGADYMTSARLQEEYLVGPADVGARVDALIAGGATVIVANSFDHRAGMVAKAAEHPEVSFLTCAGNVTNGTNLGSYFGRMEQAWFVAGKVAATKATTNHLGMIGSYITPEVVRHINAFTLGARSVKPGMQVEVRWTGFWFDGGDVNFNPTFPDPYDPMGPKVYSEEYHAGMLMQSGAEVIAHQADNGRAITYVQEHGAGAVFALANDNRWGCRAGTIETGTKLSACLGSVHWNWAPLYARLFGEIHRGVWDPTQIVNDNLEDDPDSIVGFQLETTGIDELVLKQWLNDVAGAAGISAAFEGPYNTTGQRDPMPLMARPTDEELRTMCWFVEGVVELDDPTIADPLAPGYGLHPAQVPVGGAMPALTLVPLGRAPGEGWSCNENQ